VPRSAKNFSTSARFRILTGGVSFAAVDAARALTDLSEISSQIEAAVVLDDKGAVTAATGDGERLGETGSRLLEEAARLRGTKPTQLEAATSVGSIFVLREGERTIVARTGPEPTVGLVFYDLKTCLRAIDAKPKRTRSTTTARKAPTRKKKEEDDASAP